MLKPDSSAVSSTLMATIDGLGFSHESLRLQCERMQFLSYHMKLGRSRSHPERQIGASSHTCHSKGASLICVDTAVSESLLRRICCRLPAVRSLAVSQKSAIFFRFFFLSLLLDILKAFESLSETSKSLKRKHQSSSPTSDLNFLAAVFDIVSIISRQEFEADSPWLKSRSCCLKLFDIIHFLASDNSLSRFRSDNDVLHLLSRCCDLSVVSKNAISLSIDRLSQPILTQNTTSVSNFVCDDINCHLSVELTALHLALMNQSLKYVSLITSSADNHNVNTNCSSIDSCPADDIVIQRSEHSYLELPDLLFQIRKAIVDLGTAVVSAISVIGASNLLLQLAQNDKDLISALLNSSEIELRLLHNINVSAESIVTIPAASSSSVDEVKNSEMIFYTQCKDMHDDLQKVSFGSISSFLLLLSQCIAFDATLFCDYLCSPETQSLKYLLRITKQLMLIDKNPLYPRQAACSIPKAPSNEKNIFFLDICVKMLSQSKVVRIEGMSGESSVRSVDVLEHHVDSLPIVTLPVAGVCAVDITCSENIPLDISDSENIPLDISDSGNIPASVSASVSVLGSNSVLSWIASETSTTIDDSPDTGTGRGRGEIGGDFIDKSLWGIGESDVERVRVRNVKSAPFLGQQVCPSEWLRNADEEDQKKFSSRFPVSITTRTDVKKNSVKSAVDVYEEAVALYDGTVNFLIELRNLLSKLGHSDKSLKSLPFDSSLLLRRLDAIVLFL